MVFLYYKMKGKEKKEKKKKKRIEMIFYFMVELNYRGRKKWEIYFISWSNIFFHLKSRENGVRKIKFLF